MTGKNLNRQGAKVAKGGAEEEGFRILDFEWDEAKRGGGENAEEDAEEDVMLEF